MFNIYIELCNIDIVNKNMIEKNAKDILNLSNVTGDYRIVKNEED